MANPNGSISHNSGPNRDELVSAFLAWKEANIAICRLLGTPGGPEGFRPVSRALKSLQDTLELVVFKFLDDDFEGL